MKINKLMLLAAVAALMGSFALIGCTPKEEADPAAAPSSTDAPAPDETSGDSATTDAAPTDGAATGDDHSGDDHSDDKAAGEGH